MFTEVVVKVTICLGVQTLLDKLKQGDGNCSLDLWIGRVLVDTDIVRGVVLFRFEAANKEPRISRISIWGGHFVPNDGVSAIVIARSVLDACHDWQMWIFLSGQD